MKDQNKLKIRQNQNKDKIINATVNLIKKEGINSISVRRVCEEAQIATGTFYYYFKNKDELLLSFIMESTFDAFELQTPLEDISKRVVELYSILVNKYMSFGKEFMQSFYTPTNTALSTYMSETDNHFLEDTIMARCEKELIDAQSNHHLVSTMDAHQVSCDICTIVKGIMFEYALTDTRFEVKDTLHRLIHQILNNYIQ